MLDGNLEIILFLKQKNIFVFASLKLGEKVVRTIQGGPKPCLLWEGRAGRGFHSSGIQGQGDLGKLSGPVF